MNENLNLIVIKLKLNNTESCQNCFLFSLISLCPAIGFIVKTARYILYGKEINEQQKKR